MRRHRDPARRAASVSGVVRGGLGCLLALVAAIGAGCAPSGWTQTPFAREASDAGSTFSAAAEVLEAAHSRRLTRAYVRGAFVNFGELVEGVDGRLPTLEGHPADTTVAGIVAKVGEALKALDRPCLTRECDWRSQVATLRSAAEALNEAADSAEAPVRALSALGTRDQ